MPPKKRERENNFFNVGVQGRKTGTTLKDTGIRDEHGLEPIEGIFSSPEKSPAKRSGDGTIVTSESMEVQQSSMPDPTETLTARKPLRSAKTVLPPKSRSPIKTSLGSSPRRQSSMGPPTRLQPESPTTPNRASSHPAAQRKLDFTNTQDESITSSPGEANGTGPEPDVYDLPGSPTPGHVQPMDVSIEGEVSVEITAVVEEDAGPVEIQDDSVQVEEETIEDSNEASEEQIPDPPSSPPPKKNGRKRKAEAVQDTEEEIVDARATKNAKIPKRGARKLAVEQQVPQRPARRTRSSLADSSQIQDDSTIPPQPEPDLEESVAEEEPVPVKKKGRKPKARLEVTNIPQDESPADSSAVQEQHEEEGPIPVPKKRGRPAKRDVVPQPKELSKASTSKVMPPPPTKGRGRPPKEKDANAKMPSNKAPAAKLSKERPRSGSLAPSEVSMQSARSTFSIRSNVRQFSVKPEESDDYHRSRFGRALRKPLASWRGERDIFSYNNTLVESQLTEEVTPQKTRSGPLGKGRRRRQKSIFEEPDMDDLEDWEQDPGVLSGIVNAWDHEEENTRGDREEDIAYAAPAIQTRQVDGAEFKYTRICGVRFFNAGMVDLPSYAEKKRKNSRRMHMIFFVLQGPVQVTVGDNAEFTIHSGGVWQVPRGNLYSIKNNQNTEAKVFFAQACRMRDEEEEE